MMQWTLCASLMVLGCKQPVDLGGEYRTVLDVEPEPITALDILFVVDTSGSMGPGQRDLVEAAGAHLFGTLEAELGELPDMHVAVISTDVGAGPYNISGCTGAGDDGLFQNQPQTTGCSAPSDAFLKDAPDPAGGRVHNFDGELADAFGCIARLGIDGCGFEQPLEAARRALDGRHPENDGFLRDEALLMLVVITDEDDCSVFDTQMFDTSQNDLDAPLGPLTSFRCFEFGVVCDGDDPRSEGERTHCEPRDDSEFMTAISELVDFFRGVKPDPGRVAVTLVSGGADGVEVASDGNGNPRLAPVCTREPPPECADAIWPPDAGPGDDPPDAGPLTPGDCWNDYSRTDPSVRLNAFLDEFPGRSHFAPICDLAMSSHLESTARLAADIMGRRPCLRGELVDANREQPGIQAKCRGYDVTMASGAEVGRTDVPSCSESGGALPCFTLAEDAECDHLESTLAARVQRGQSATRPAHFVVECLAPLRGGL
jgi:hypothetical protein